MEKSEVLPIDERYNNEMLSVLRASPINANGLSLYFDKSPDIFEIPRMKYSLNEHVGFFVDDIFKGFASLGFYNALINGNVENVFMFYNFYLLPEARGKNIPGLAMKRFFQQAGRSSANFGIALTLKGNRSTESYIGSQRDEWMPPSRVIDEWVVKTILFAKPKKNETNYKVRSALLDDMPAIVKLLQKEHRQRDFGLLFNEDSFLQELQKRGLKIEDYYVAEDTRGEVKGVCLSWDCSPFRRTTVLKFSYSFYPYLAGYKLAEKVFGMAPFPGRGESFNELTITDYAVANRDPLIMHALLSEVYYRNHNQKYHFMNWASCASDNLLIAAKGFWCKNIISHIIFTSLASECCNVKTHLPYIDIAFI